MKGTIRLATVTICRSKGQYKDNQSISQVITEYQGQPYNLKHIFETAFHKIFPSRKDSSSYKIKSIEIDFSKDFGNTLYELNPELINK